LWTLLWTSLSLSLSLSLSASLSLSPSPSLLALPLRCCGGHLCATQRLAGRALALVAGLAGVAVHTTKVALQRTITHGAALAAQVLARPAALTRRAPPNVVAVDGDAIEERCSGGIATDGARSMAALCTATVTATASACEG
jgi:hypothetical protein